MKSKKILVYVIMIIVLISFLGTTVSCTADIRPDMLRGNNQLDKKLEIKGRDFMAKVYKAHGVDALLKHKNYKFTVVDHWQGIMSVGGVMWPQDKTRMAFKYATNTFDAQLLFLDGERKGVIAGQQSWKYYEKEVSGSIKFMERNKRYSFGMAAFQYFTELAGRLSKAPIIRYAGVKTIKKVKYDLVFATWGSLEQNDRYDQYVLHINPENNLIEYVTFTIRDNYISMPGTGVIYSTMAYRDYRDIDGFKVSFEQTLYVFDPPEDDDDYLHRLTLESFEFGGFELSELYPNKNLKKIGDVKVH